MFERKCPVPLQYGPQSLLLEAYTHWHERKGTHLEITCSFTRPQRRHEKVGWKIHLCPSSTGVWVERKANHHRKFFKHKCCFRFQWASCQTQWKDWMLFLLLLKWPQGHIYKTWTMTTVTRTRGALPPAGWKWQPNLLDCVALMAWCIRPGRV